MGAFITAAGAIQGRYECGLLVVHHAGKDATKGLRGHSSLLGAVDTELEIIRIEGAQPPKGILHISKQKDGEDGQRIGFKMVEVSSSNLNIAHDDSTSSLAVEPDADMDTTQKATKEKNKDGLDRKGNGPVQQLALTCLHDAIKVHGEMQTIAGMRNKCIKLDKWRDEFKSRSGSDILQATFNTNWWKSKRDLQNLKKVVIKDEWCWAVFGEVEAIDTPVSNVHSLVK
jgi:hypothetical protein